MTTHTLKARPTTYNGIQMRSRLEARYAALLDARGQVWDYEPQAFANRSGQYLPDFVLRPVEAPATDDEPAFSTPSTYIEVRPHVTGMQLALTQMPIIWDSEPYAFLLITAPSQRYEWFAMGRGDRKWMVLPCEPWE